MVKGLFVALCILSVLASAISAQSANNITSYSKFGTWLPIILLAIVVSILIASLYYITGLVMNNHRVKANAVSELEQVVGTGIVTVIIIGIFALMGSGQFSLVSLLNPSSMNTVCTQLSQSSFSFLNSNYAFTPLGGVSTNTVATDVCNGVKTILNPPAHADLITPMIDYGLFYSYIIVDNLTNQAANNLNSFYVFTGWIGFLSKFTSRSTICTPVLCLIPGYDEGSTSVSYSYQPLAGYSMILSMIKSTQLEAVLTFYVMLMQLLVITFFLFAWPYILAAGIILRSSFFTRRTGGLLMAISLVAVLIYPILYGMEYGANRITVIATPIITTTLANGGTIALGSSETDSATLSGATSGATGTITFYTWSDSACTAGRTSEGALPVTGNGPYSPSSSVTYNNAGTYYWDAEYSGDSNNKPAKSACEQLTVGTVAPTITTQLASNPIGVGQSEKDNAILSGATSTAGGTITFYTYGTDSTCTAGISEGTSSVSGNGPYGPSSSVTYGSAGIYYWNAVYSGDANNNPAKSACEPVTVSKAATTITTQLSSGSINVGQSVSDNAMLSGATSSATGTITFYIYGTDSTCTGAHAPEGTSSVTGNGPYGPSSSVTYSNAGTYYWDAEYSGDSNNNPSKSACEQLIVGMSAPTISTAFIKPSPINIGQSETDNAILSGATSGAGGNIKFYTYTDSVCTAGPTLISTSIVSGNGNYGPSSPVTYNNAGTYYWNAVYSGDANNNPATSICEALKVSVPVIYCSNTDGHGGGIIKQCVSDPSYAVCDTGLTCSYEDSYHCAAGQPWCPCSGATPYMIQCTKVSCTGGTYQGAWHAGCPLGFPDLYSCATGAGTGACHGGATTCSPVGCTLCQEPHSC